MEYIHKDQSRSFQVHITLDAETKERLDDIVKRNRSKPSVVIAQMIWGMKV